MNVLALSTNDESITKGICEILGDKPQLPGKAEPPFIHLVLFTDCNNVNANQCREQIEINTSNYIDHVFTSCGWNDTFKHTIPNKSLFPISEDSIAKVFDTSYNTIEGSTNHKDHGKKMEFQLLLFTQ